VSSTRPTNSLVARNNPAVASQQLVSAEHYDRHARIHTLPNRRLHNPSIGKIDQTVPIQVFDQR